MKKIALAAFSATALLALSACGDAADDTAAEDTTVVDAAPVEPAPVAEDTTAVDATADAAADAAADSADAAADSADAAADSADAADAAAEYSVSSYAKMRPPVPGTGGRFSLHGALGAHFRAWCRPGASAAVKAGVDRGALPTKCGPTGGGTRWSRALWPLRPVSATGAPRSRKNTQCRNPWPRHRISPICRSGSARTISTG